MSNTQHQPDTSPLAGVLDELAHSSDYTRGVLDVLRLLGLIRMEGNEARPAGKVPAMVLNSLRAHLQDGVTVGLNWDDLDTEGLRGVDILRAIEAARLARVMEPTPGRLAQAAVAVIKAQWGNESLYLMQYDAHAGRYQPIGGKQEASDRDLAETLRREMAEELGLPGPPGPKDCTLRPILQEWCTTELSATYGILTRYTFAFFNVENVRFPLTTNDDTRWLTRDEIAAGRARDGRVVSPLYGEALGLALLDELPADVVS